MDLGDDVLNSLVAATVFFDAGRIYLVGRNLEAVWSAEERPTELQNFVDDDVYKQMRQDTISEARYEATSIVFSFGVKLLKLALRYYPTIWNMTGDYSSSLFKRAAWFYALDSFLTRTVFVPATFVDALVRRSFKNPITILLNSLLRNLVNAGLSAAGALVIIYITDRYGTTAFIVVTVFSNILGLMAGALKIKLKKELLQPLRSDILGEKLKSLANSVNYPEDNIYIHAKPATPPEVTFERCFGTHIISINQPLLALLTPEQITGLVAHEMGHWHYHHSTFQQAFSLFHSACLCFVCVKSLDNEWITDHFGFSEKPHPFVPLYLSVFYFWPLAKSMLDYFLSISKRRSEIVADDFVVAEGHASHLRSSLLTLAGQSKCYPIFDPWYSGWIYGYPTVFERIARLDPRKRVTINTPT